MAEMSALIDAADEILAWLRQHQRVVVDLLQPGLSEDAVRAEHTPFALSPGVAGLYRWRNGTRLSQEHALDDHYFVPGYYFLALEDALAARRTYGDIEWKSWLPLFANGGGDFYVVDHQSGQILSFMNDLPDAAPIYASVTAMLKTAAACYRQGAYFVGGDGLLDVNEEAEKQLARRHNPGIAYWEA